MQHASYRYHKLLKTLTILNSKLNSLAELPEPEFYGDLVYNLKKITGSNNFSEQFIKIISHYKKDWL